MSKKVKRTHPSGRTWKAQSLDGPFSGYSLGIPVKALGALRTTCESIALSYSKPYSACGSSLAGSYPELRNIQLDTFFPRVRTPCGHGAQVIVEGREEQSDGGERNKDPNQPKPNTKARRPKLHHLVVFPLHWVKRVKRRLVAITGPEFSREKGRQRKLCSWKAA